MTVLGEQPSAEPRTLVATARQHSLGDLPRRTAIRFPDKIGLIDGGTRLTYRELDGAIDRVATFASLTTPRGPRMMPVEYELRGGAARLTLARPDRGDAVASPDGQEGLRAFFAKTPPSFPSSQGGS